MQTPCARQGGKIGDNMASQRQNAKRLEADLGGKFKTVNNFSGFHASLCISVCHFALHELGGDAVVAAELEMKIDLPAAVLGSPPKVGRVYSASSGETLSQAGRRSSL